MRFLRLLLFMLMVNVAAFAVASAATVGAQETTGLSVEGMEVSTQTDLFGLPAIVAEGQLVNTTDDTAYTGITLFAEVYDADDELIGEGLGYPVTACGTGLLPDFALQPGGTQAFSVTLEFYEGDTDYERVEIIPEFTETDPARTNPFLSFQNTTQIADGEVVAVEWIDANRLRYGVGCDGQVFTSFDWYEYDLTEDEAEPITHPEAATITPALLQQTDLEAPGLLERSFLSFHPNVRRILYQSDINTLVSAEPDGSFKRLIYDNLARYSLHGFQWLPEGRFLAYYYGAYGEPVRYFTASTQGQRISGDITVNPSSLTIPGATPGGDRAVITATVEDTTGYYLQSLVGGGSELLFEAQPPGNNYPAPLYVPVEGDSAYIYIVNPVEGRSRLQCYTVATGELTTLTLLPMNLTPDDRGWMFLSPDSQKIALAANGGNGGLWMIDLADFDECVPGVTGA